ncbi:CATRA system-associated protein [Cryptosporangium japonicum]|uniref:CATRA-Associated Small Protein domain-containing protein n=1 Tax=Cryptosporangium japonicum TaxID=80872 RepID=A0ABP3ERA2_9ACTN
MPGSESVSTLPTGLVEEFRHVLADLSGRWRLPAADWASVESWVARGEDALRTGDRDELTQVVRELAYYGSARAVDASRGAREGPPPRVRERTRRIVHTLQPPPHDEPR